MKKDLKPGDLFNAHQAKMKKKALKLNPPSKGRTPTGAHGKAAVKALGRTKTTGNFAKIQAAKGKGAAIAAYQNVLKAHKGKKKYKGLNPSPKMSVVDMSSRKPSIYKKGIKKHKHVQMAKQVVKASGKKQIKAIVKIQKSHIKGKK